MLPRSGDDLPRVGFFDPKDVCNLAVGIVEGLSKYVRRALGWRELLQQKQNREVQRLAPLDPQARIGAGVDRLRQPWAYIGVSARASGLEHVDRESRGRRDQEGQRIADRAPISGLPPNPDVLDDVLGLRRATQHPIRNAKQPRPGTQECREAIVSAGRKGRGVLAVSRVRGVHARRRLRWNTTGSCHAGLRCAAIQIVRVDRQRHRNVDATKKHQKPRVLSPTGPRDLMEQEFSWPRGDRATSVGSPRKGTMLLARARACVGRRELTRDLVVLA
jgi:hypothetical protein